MTVIVDETQLNAHIKHLADDIYKTNSGNIVFLGLGDNGFILATRLSKFILQHFETTVLVGKLDVTLYKSHHNNDHFVNLGKSDISFSLQNKTVILISDQVNTGKTMIAGLNALSDYGEPLVVKCCCLIFRECMTRPIHFQYIGETISKSVVASLTCCFYEKDGEDCVKHVVHKEDYV